MDKSTKRYRNYNKTETAIKKALILLYKEKGELSKITVKELCEVANISRSTFYLHYNDMISIFEKVGDKFVDSLKSMVVELSKNKPTDFLSYFKKIFELLNDASELIKIGLSSEYPLIYIERVKDQLEDILKNSQVLKQTKLGREQTMIEIRIVVSGMIDFIIHIIRTDEYKNIDKYANILNNFLIRWTTTLM